MTGAQPRDEAAVAEAVEVFFAAFTSGPGLAERMERLRAAFLPQAVVVKTCGGEPEA